MRKRQRTILAPVTLEGAGLHTGITSSVTFHPAPENHGIVFVRTDLEGSPTIPANVDYVADTLRGTTLANESGAVVRTVEHVLSALVGLEIDNCRVELSAEELPAADGSAKPFAEALTEAGFEDQNAARTCLMLDKTVQLSHGDGGTEYTLMPSEQFSTTVFIDYAINGFAAQNHSLGQLDEEYTREIAPARTFCFLSEVEELRSRGLIRGGQIHNAVVISDVDSNMNQMQNFVDEWGVSPEFEEGRNDVLIGEAFRFQNEPARHKLLDLMGDLALVGAPLCGHLIAVCPGHSGNIEFARTLKRLADKKGLFKRFDLSDEAEPVKDVNAVMQILPHRYPFLLVDKVIDLDEKAGRITGVKNVTVNEPFFQGHFPGFPIMPGVLIVEAMAQTGGMLLMNDIGIGEDKIAVFMGIKDAKFRRPVVPGDRLFLELVLKGKRFNTYTMQGKATVGGKVAAQAEITVAVIDRQQA